MISAVNYINRKFKGLIIKVRSRYYTSKITSGNGQIIIINPFVKFRIIKAEGAQFIVNGKFLISSHLGGNSPIYIELGKSSIFQIDGDFAVGHGVTILVNEGGELYIGGKDKESNSGITCDTTIMVYKKVKIGKDFLCAWDVFISDSDWHHIDGQSHQADVLISDHVWVAHKSSILKGTAIGKGCIVASHSKLINKIFPEHSLIGGTPAKILKTSVNWCRDLKDNANK